MSSRKLSDFNSQRFVTQSGFDVQAEEGPNYMKTFLTQLKQDPEVYSLFVSEAASRGYYNEKRIRNQTLTYSKKGYFESFIEKDNRRFECDRTQEIKKFILHRDTEMSRQERVQFHLDKLLTQEERSGFNFVPPKKQEFPLAFPPEGVTSKKKELDGKKFDLNDFLRRQMQGNRPRRIREDASFELMAAQ